MAVRSDKTVRIPRSTGAAPFDGEPVTVVQTDDNTSTDAVPYDAPGETVVDYYGEDPVVVSQTPSEPVTMSVSWLSEPESPEDVDPQVKVVEPPVKKSPRSRSRAQTA